MPEPVTTGIAFPTATVLMTIFMSFARNEISVVSQSFLHVSVISQILAGAHNLTHLCHEGHAVIPGTSMIRNFKKKNGDFL